MTAATLASSPARVRKQNGHGEDPVSEDQAVLDDGRHRDHVHVTAAQDGSNSSYPFRFQMFQSCYSQKTGVLDDHLVILYHIQEGTDELCHRKQ